MTCVPGEGDVKDNPVIRCLDRMKQLDCDSMNQFNDKDSCKELVEVLELLVELSSVTESGNAAIATRNGAVELVCSVCSKIQIEHERPLVSSLKALALLLHGILLTYSNLPSAACVLVTF